MKTIIEDKREIETITFPDGDEYTIVGHKDWSVDKIVPYHENGEMAKHVWFAIYKNGEIKNRVNSSHVDTVCYNVCGTSVEEKTSIQILREAEERCKNIKHG